MKNEKKLIELITKLKDRNNEAYKFFEGLLIELKDKEQRKIAIKKLSSCFAITQYADFTFEEEKLLSEIIDENKDYE
jgi:hypothetical protein